jgi:putative endopeptidase
MPTLRPLALALIAALALSLHSPTSLAAKKPASQKKPATSSQALACNDLYAEANKGWLAANTMPEAGAISALGQLNERALQQQRQLLDGFMQAPRNDRQRLLGDFWASGLDESALERDGATAISPLLKRVTAIRTGKDVAQTIATLHQTGIPVAFAFVADSDPRDVRRTIGLFTQGGLGLPDPAYYTRTDAETQALLARYASHIRRILALTGVAPQDIETQTAMALDVEKRIAALSKPLPELREAHRNATPIDTATLGKQFRNLQLDTFLKTQGVTVSSVAMTDPALFAQLDTLISQLRPAQWQAYLRWRIGDAMAPYLAKPWREAAFDFHGKTLRGQEAAAPRWEDVLGVINQVAGPLLGQEYAATYLPDSTREQAGRIAQHVQQVLRQTIADGHLLQGAAQAEALKKIDTLRIEVGTPPADWEGLPQPVSRTSFGSNVLAAAAWQHRQDMRRINQGTTAAPVWNVPPQRPALAYDLTHNRLIITAAILQPPVFDPAMPIGSQYGALGALIGHELIHVIDGAGRYVNAQGTLTDWWSAEDDARWQALAARITRFYERLPYPGVANAHVDGARTRDENFADLAGLTLAQAALRLAQPNPDTQTQKSFYIGWAQLWAQQVAPEEAQRRAHQDVRAPGVWRANAAAMQQPGFATAFACKAGAKMLLPDTERINVLP